MNCNERLASITTLVLPCPPSVSVSHPPHPLTLTTPTQCVRSETRHPPPLALLLTLVPHSGAPKCPSTSFPSPALFHLPPPYQPRRVRHVCLEAPHGLALGLGVWYILFLMLLSGLPGLPVKLQLTWTGAVMPCRQH
ncbi:hypothetical protein PoB_005671500 [Plakobranchus ocellatus]|uniref:Uncharacterized protein n=1 Tax=Plakobranchus ocellatus TaxID=259542 RepID=A0AAV4CFG1_9GAST|nr:hypothetical protein PoB_005671500 [Plakobranchus ocellatus]